MYSSYLCGSIYTIYEETIGYIKMRNSKDLYICMQLFKWNFNVIGVENRNVLFYFMQTKSQPNEKP